jgi:hypothetical protein
MANLNFKIAAQLDAAGFTEAAEHLRQISKAQDDANGSAGALKQGYSDLMNQMLGFASVVGVIEFFKSCVDVSGQTEEAMSLLGTKVNSTGADFNKLKPQVEAFTKAISESTRFSKVDAINALGDMVDRTRDLGAAEDLMTVSMNYAVATHKSLAEASNIVAGVQENQARATKSLGRELGLTVSQQNDSAEVLAVLKERYDGLAESEDTFESKQKKLTNAVTDFKEEVGTGLAPIVTVVIDTVTKAVRAFPEIIRYVTDSLQVMSAGAYTPIFDVLSKLPIIGKQFKVAADALRNDTKAFTEGAAEDWGKWDAAVQDKVKSNLGALQVAAEKRKKLEGETVKAIADFNAQGLTDNQKIINAKIAQENAAFPLRLQQLKEQLGALHESQENYRKAEKAATDAHNRVVLQLEMSKWKEMYDMSGKSAVLIGQSTALMLRGDKDAWKDSLKNIIDMIAQKAEAHVLASSWEEAGEHAAALDYVGAAGAVAKGLAVAGLIAGIAEGAKAAIGSESSAASVSSSSGATGSNTSSTMSTQSVSAPSSPTTSTPAQQNIVIKIEGNGDQQFLSQLCDRMSGYVENSGGRLVATKTRVM